MQIMRNSLRDTISGSLKDSHAGLLLQRGLREWESETRTEKEKLIQKVSNSSFSNLYKLAYERWEEITSNSPRFAFTPAKIVGRLYTGLGISTALETHLTTHHTYGMPMLAGSSVKGAVAAYAEKIGLPENVRAILFGDEDNAGAVVWHDAWWIPTLGAKPFVGEIVTTHHQDYYNGKQKVADEMESPIPNQQIACQGSFYFVVECDKPDWAAFANQLLFETLQNQGLGSKTASGYGYFELDKKYLDEMKKNQVSSDDLAGQLGLLTETELYENLSKNKNKFFEKHGLNKDNDDDMKKLVGLILANEDLSAYVNSWANEKGNNKEKAFKFIQKYKEKS